jgi:hypothetical protein
VQKISKYKKYFFALEYVTLRWSTKHKIYCNIVLTKLYNGIITIEHRILYNNESSLGVNFSEGAYTIVI